MFEKSLVESAALLRTHNRWPALLSIALQFSAAALILSLPLLHPELLPLPRLLPATIAPPRPPAPPPLVHLTEQPASAKPSLTTPAPLCHCDSSSTRILHAPPSAAGEPSFGPIDLRPIDFGAYPSPLPLTIGGNPSGPRISVRPNAMKPAGIARISSGVSAGLLLAPIRPAYPAIAKAARTEGTVIVDAIISRTGSIESAHAVSGAALLQPAAVSAVREAHYRPFLLNGQPTAVQTTFTIVFRMND
jgi:protein TonB